MNYLAISHLPCRIHLSFTYDLSTTTLILVVQSILEDHGNQFNPPRATWFDAPMQPHYRVWWAVIQ